MKLRTLVRDTNNFVKMNELLANYIKFKFINNIFEHVFIDNVNTGNKMEPYRLRY